MRKYWIIKNIFKGKPVNTNVNIEGILPIFIAHHSIPSLKTRHYGDMRRDSLKTIIKWVYDEKIVFLSNNNHILLHSPEFVEYSDFISPAKSKEIKRT